MYPISDELTYEAQDSTTYVNPQHPTYVVSGAAGTQSSPFWYGKFIREGKLLTSTLELAVGDPF
jgi:hypothetical protein